MTTTSIDWLGYLCTPYDKLTEAFAQADKYFRVPQTCSDTGSPLSDGWLAWAIGRAPTPDELATYHYRWLTEMGLGTFDFHNPLLVTPLPLGAVTLASAMMILLWQTRK